MRAVAGDSYPVSQLTVDKGNPRFRKSLIIELSEVIKDKPLEDLRVFVESVDVIVAAEFSVEQLGYEVRLIHMS